MGKIFSREIRSVLVLAIIAATGVGAAPAFGKVDDPECVRLLHPSTLDPEIAFGPQDTKFFKRIPASIKEFFGYKPSFFRDYSRHEIKIAYAKLIEYSLQHGALPADLKRMAETGKLFEVPGKNRNLKAINRHLKYIERRFGHEFTTADAESLLKRYGKLKADEIVPGYVPEHSAYHTAGLAPREEPAGTSEIIVYLIPSPMGLDWDSPGALLGSTMKNQMSSQSHRIGHVNIEIRQDNKTLLFTGMTGSAQHGDSLRSIKNGDGFNTMFKGYTGWLEGYQELIPEYEALSLTGRLSYMRIRVNEDAVKNMLAHFRQFTADGGHETYSLLLNPLKAEGAGCSSFAMSFLESAGLIEPEQRTRWSRTIQVPERLLGNSDGNAAVTPWNMLRQALAGKLKTWGQPGEKARPIFFWDPDLIDSWIREQFSRGPAQGFPTERYNFTDGIRLDYSHKAAPSLLPKEWSHGATPPTK